MRVRQTGRKSANKGCDRQTKSAKIVQLPTEVYVSMREPRLKLRKIAFCEAGQYEFPKIIRLRSQIWRAESPKMVVAFNESSVSGHSLRSCVMAGAGRPGNMCN